MSSVAVMGESEATRQKKKRPKLKHVEVGVALTQSPHASELLPATPFLKTPAQSPAPGTPILQEVAAMRKERKIRKEQKTAPLPLPPNPNLEEEEAVMATMKNRNEPKYVENMLLPPSASTGKTPIFEQEEKVTKKRKRMMDSPLPLHPGHASKSLLATPLLQHPAPEILTLKEAAAMMRKRKMPKEQKVDALPFAQNSALEEEQGEEAMMTMMKKKEPKRVEQILLSFSTSVAVGNPIQDQEVKVIKKQKQRRGQEPSAKSQKPDNSPSPLHSGHASKPLLAAPLLQPPAPEILTLKEAAAMIMKRKMPKEQKVDVLPFAQNPTLEEEQEEEAMMTMMKEPKRVEQILLPLSISVAVGNPIQGQEVKVIKKQKQRRGQEPSGKSQKPGNSPLPLHSGHASKPLLAAPPLQSSAPKILTLGEAAAMMRKRKMCKEQKVAAPSFSQNPTLEEEQGEEAMTATTKERKHVEQILPSPSTSVAAETPIEEQEVKVTKKQKERRGQEPSGKSPLPLDPGQTCCVQSQRAKAPPEQEGEYDGCKGIKKSNSKNPRVRVLSKRELIQEARRQQRPLPEGFVPFSNFVASCTEQNPDHSPPYSAFFDQFRYDPVCGDRKPPFPRTPDRLARLPPRGYSSFESSQLAANETSRASKSNTTLAFKTKLQDSVSGSQEKVNVKVKENPENKTWEKKQRKPSSKFDPSQTCCVQLQGTKAPPDQDQETDAPKINNIDKSNSKKARARAPIKRKLFKEVTKGQVLPEGFLVPRDFVPNCTEQSPNYSSPYGASFDQFCYRSARQDLHPQPPRTTDCLSKLPPLHYPSFESSELTVSETSKAFKANNSVASKSKKKDSGSGPTSGSQKKLNVREKKNPEKKMTTTKQRKPPPVFTTAEKRSDKYRRVPLDQLVPPPRSPHNLLQENYASDPWKVIIICMFLNVTQGVQVSS
jgi:hypothetical protein